MALRTADGPRFATIDTGATISTVNEKHAGRIDRTETINIQGIGGQQRTEGTTILEFQTGNSRIQHKFYILADSNKLPNGMLIELDFLDTYKAVIDLEAGLMTIRIHSAKGCITETLKLEKMGKTPKKQVMIAGRTSQMVKIQVPGEDPEVVILPEILENGVFLAGALSKVTNGHAYTQVLNTNKDDRVYDEIVPRLHYANGYNVKDEEDDKDREKGEDRWEQLEQLLKTDGLTETEKGTVKRICRKYADVFKLPSDRLTTTPIAQQQIHLKPGVTPTYTKPFRNPYHQRHIAIEHVEKMKEDDIIEPSISAWNSPLLIVPKKSMNKDGTRQYRVVIDYRKLNERIEMDKYPLPNIHDLLDQLGSAKIFTCMDLSQGYYQVELEEASRPCTAFITPDGKHYQMKRLPMGLNVSPSAFSRIMALALAGLTGMMCLVYLDDLVIFSKTAREHERDLEEVFHRLRKVRLQVHPEKSHFFRRTVIFLGYKISENGVETDPEKCEKIRNFPQPRTKKELQQFLGLANFYRQFVKNFAELATPLTALTRKRVKYIWSDECEKGFRELKAQLCGPRVLAFPNFDKEFVVHTDASKHSLGAVLSNADMRPVHFASRALRGAEERYSTIEKELLAVVFAMRTFRQYLLGRHFTLRTDHAPLRWLFGMNDPASRLTKFRLELEPYHFTVEHVPGKDNVVADCLSRISSETLKEQHRRIEAETEHYAAYVVTRAQKRNEQQPTKGTTVNCGVCSPQTKVRGEQARKNGDY